MRWIYFMNQASPFDVLDLFRVLDLRPGNIFFFRILRLCVRLALRLGLADFIDSAWARLWLMLLGRGLSGRFAVF